MNDEMRGLLRRKAAEECRELQETELRDILVRPCPFCGKVPALSEDRYDPSEMGFGPKQTKGQFYEIDPGYVMCETQGCALFGIPLSPLRWQRRVHKPTVIYQMVQDGGISGAVIPSYRKD